ncbi:LysR family transcriptional regulator [Streptomyces sp. NPDC001262]|uniref:LysR family transcriptional regulator n=1 Tax=Streptomyces sp. NPDC001262 TaxID=3364552 RepID=UPI003694A17E
MVTLRQLQYMLAIVEEGSFTRAAQRLHISQPALSRQLQALERFCGGSLVEREARPLRLTALGQAIQPHVRAAVAEADRIRPAAARAVSGLGSELQLAALDSVSLGLLPPVLRAWHESHPAMEVRLTEHRRAEDLAAALGEGRADIAIGPVLDGWHGARRLIGVAEFMVVLPPGDTAAARPAGVLPLAELADRAWVRLAPGSTLSAVLDDACAAAGFTPKSAVQTEQSAATPWLAASGLGPALVPAYLLPPHFTGHTVLPDPPVRQPLFAYTAAAPGPVVAGFVEVLVRHARVARGPDPDDPGAVSGR